MSSATRAQVPPVARDFLLRQRMVVIGALGLDGRPWAGVLTGEAGFLRAENESEASRYGPPTGGTGSPRAGGGTVRGNDGPVPADARGVLYVDGLPAADEPLHDAFAEPRPVGMVAVDFATRRRMRMNGRAEAVGGGLRVVLDQVYANCPKYIQRREPLARAVAPASAPVVTSELSPGAQGLVRAADTFFIASADTGGAADASHRGGPPGFVTVRSGRRLTWPDYAGNGMFNTLGNIAADPRAGLLFAD